MKSILPTKSGFPAASASVSNSQKLKYLFQLILTYKLLFHPLHSNCVLNLNVMGEIAFFFENFSAVWTIDRYTFFGQISSSAVAQLVECWTLDLEDPVQMGSRGEFFFRIFCFHFRLTAIL